VEKKGREPEFAKKGTWLNGNRIVVKSSTKRRQKFGEEGSRGWTQEIFKRAGWEKPGPAGGENLGLRGESLKTTAERRSQERRDL